MWEKMKKREGKGSGSLKVRRPNLNFFSNFFTSGTLVVVCNFGHARRPAEAHSPYSIKRIL